MMIDTNVYLITLIVFTIALCVIAWYEYKYRVKRDLADVVTGKIQGKVNEDVFDIIASQTKWIKALERKVKTLRDVVVMVGKKE